MHRDAIHQPPVPARPISGKLCLFITPATTSNLLLQDGDEWPVDGMYKSLVLKHAIEMLYMTQPWRDVILLPWFKDDDLELSPVFDPNEDSYASRPPTSFVAFVAATVSPFRHFSTSLTSYPTASQCPHMHLNQGS